MSSNTQNLSSCANTYEKDGLEVFHDYLDQIQSTNTNSSPISSP